MIDFTPWPSSLVKQYKQAGYWQDKVLTDIVADGAEQFKNDIALICQDRQFSYERLEKLTEELAQRFAAMGLKQGDTALVHLPNCAEFYITFFALLKCGVAPVNALNNHGRFELLAFSKQIKPDLVVLSGGHALLRDGEESELIIGLKRQAVDRQRIIVHTGEYNSVSRCLGAFVDLDGRVLLANKTKAISPTPVDQVAFFQLSGGSTGTPKLIPRTHNDYFYSITQSAKVCELTNQCVFLSCLPAGHNFTLSSPGALGVWYAGGTVVVSPDPEANFCFDLIAEHKVNWAALVPTAVTMWLNYAQESKQDISSLAVVQVGGSKLNPPVAEKIPQILGCQLQQVFGMAEGLVNYTRLNDNRWVINNTQGRPMSPADEISIRDQDGKEVELGEIGHLWTRGPYTFRGYYNSAEHNNEAFDNEGFYCTGDLVKQTASGELIVMGRSKEQINRGGEKIDVQEVEDLLTSYPEVELAAVVSSPDEVLGERSFAYIQTPTSIKPSQLRRFLRGLGVADFKLPDKFEFCRQLPTTAVGKVNKKALSEQSAVM